MNEPSNTPPSTPPEDAETYTLTVEEASALFAEAGTPRSPRTIIRYCSKGHLRCIKADTQQNERYLIDRDSVDRRIQELKQLAVSRRDESSRDTSGRDATTGERDRIHEGDEAVPELTKRVGELESEVRDLQITNRAKDYVLDQYKSERAGFIEELSSKSYRIGQLEAQLQIGAPGPVDPSAPDTSRLDETRREDGPALSPDVRRDSAEELDGREKRGSGVVEPPRSESATAESA